MKPFRSANMHHYDESELLDLTMKAFLEVFPNCERIGCPDPALRENLARGNQNLTEHWDVFDHICMCSPCFAEYLAARKRVLRRGRVWLVCGLAVFAVMCVTGYTTWRIFGNVVPNLSTADLRKGIPPLPSLPAEAFVKSATLARLDFRDWSVTRSDGEVPSPFMPPTLKRANLSLRIELPLFSPAGQYRVSLRAATGELLMDRMAVAHIIDGRTILESIQIDLSSTERGLYTLSLETTGLPTLRKFPIHLE